MRHPPIYKYLGMFYKVMLRLFRYSGFTKKKINEGTHIKHVSRGVESFCKGHQILWVHNDGQWNLYENL